MATLERTFTIDRDLARRANRKLRRYGTDLNGLLSIVVSSRGLPFLPEPLSLEFVVDGQAKRPRRRFDRFNLDDEANISQKAVPFAPDLGGRKVASCRITDAARTDAEVQMPSELPPHSFVLLKTGE